MFFIVGYLLAGRMVAFFLVCLKCQFLKE